MRWLDLAGPIPTELAKRTAVPLPERVDRMHPSGIRAVADNDFLGLGLPYCDALTERPGEYGFLGSRV